jgi:hypothetical protein
MGCVLVSAVMVSADVLKAQWPAVFGLTQARARTFTTSRRPS